MDTDADRDLYSHACCDANTYCHADADRDTDLYEHTYSDACPERSRRADAHGYFYRHACPERSRRARTDSDARFAHGHADASVSVPT